MQTIKAKDVLHLYQGCKLQTDGYDHVFNEIRMHSIDQWGIIKAVGIAEDDPVHYPITGTWFGNTDQPQLPWFKLVLKRLESLDMADVVRIEEENPFRNGSLEKRSYITLSLTKLGVDIFNLIDSGEAIEETE